MLDREASYRALQARDPRFDGRVFIGVVTTGVFCRPVCPAPTARFENCRFYRSAAAAQEEGFRPCLRCRPELVADLGGWRHGSWLVGRALERIHAGYLDDEANDLGSLARELDITSRHLRRLFQEQVGASPIAVAQSRRVLLAKQLLHDTRLPITEVAFAAGFRSLRRFNETFRALFGRPPSALRRHQRASGGAGVSLRLRYRAPFDWSALLAFFAARAIDGVEWVEDGRYARCLRHDGEVGRVVVHDVPADHHLVAELELPSLRGLGRLVAQLRRLFDLDADPAFIGAHLRRDPWLAPLVSRHPGLRVPGAWDPFEQAVRAVLGQQITVEAARRLGAQLVRATGERTPLEDARLGHVFPSPPAVLAADLSTLRMPRARRQALVTLAEAASRDPSLFRGGASAEAVARRLDALPGIGGGPGQLGGLRALGDPDAFPASDAALLRAVSDREAARGHDRTRPKPRDLERRAEPWRPWRGYAAQHLWASLGDAPSPESPS